MFLGTIGFAREIDDYFSKIKSNKNSNCVFGG